MLIMKFTASLSDCRRFFVLDSLTTCGLGVGVEGLLALDVELLDSHGRVNGKDIPFFSGGGAFGSNISSAIEQ